MCVLVYVNYIYYVRYACVFGMYVCMFVCYVCVCYVRMFVVLVC